MNKSSLSLFSIITIILIMAFSSCEDDKGTPILKVSQTTFTLAANELTETFSITANVGWVISSDQSWCTVSPQYGSGNETIAITLSGNNEDLKNDRTAVLTVKSGQTNAQEIEVTQLAAPSLPTSANEFELFFTEGTTMTCYGYWYYFSFEKGKLIDFSTINTEEDESWRNRTDWDIAFSTFYSKTNSGVSGKGLGGVQIVGEEAEDKATFLKNWLLLRKKDI
ncbi:MAG: hypothetical protein LIP01_05245 [Tannerellaceae bacterium]|nr:hypothetical protein [Tannerellaceae bacterium]